MLETILSEIGQCLLSIIAIIIASKKGKTTKTVEEIEALEETRKQKRIAKQLKKNKIKPIEKSTNENIRNANENFQPIEEKPLSLKEKIEMYGE